MNILDDIEFATNGATVAQNNFEEVDARISRYAGKCRVATAAALPANTRTGSRLIANANGAINGTGIDGITNLALNHRVLVKNEAAQANNGLYYILALGSGGAPWILKRAHDANEEIELLSGLETSVAEGTVNAGTTWQLTTADPIVINSTALVFAQMGVAGTGSVTSFSAGNLSPLFSTSVATATTTPAL